MSKVLQSLKGTGVALITPFNKKNEIDFNSLEKLLRHIALEDIQYYVIAGSSGENLSLSYAEKESLVKFIDQKNIKKIPLVLGVMESNTESILNALQSIDYKLFQVLLISSPFYHKPSQEGIYRHYIRIADASLVPIILYNIPSRTGNHIAIETILRLAEHPNIIGVKESSGNVMLCVQISYQKPKDFLLIAGEDSLILPILSVGGEGVISAVANVYPKQISRIVQYALKQDYVAARKNDMELLPVHEIIKKLGNPVATKQLLYEKTICSPYVRLPLVRLGKKESKKIKNLSVLKY